MAAKSENAELSEDQINSIRQALGIGSGVPDADIRELMATPQGQQALQKIQNQPSGGGPGGFLGFAEALPGALLRTAKDTAPLAALPLTGPLDLAMMAYKGATQPSGAKAPPKKGGGKTTPPVNPYSELAQILSQSLADQGMLAFGQEGTQLAQQNQNVASLVDQQMQAAGAASGNPAVAAAMSAYTTAYNTGAGIEGAALSQSGQANQQYIASAQYSPLLQMLSSLSNPEYQALPAGLVGQLPKSVQQVLANRGIGEVPSNIVASGATAITPGRSGTGTQNIGQILAQATGQKVPPTVTGAASSGTTNTSNVTQ
jgi:hypothetical protein